MTSHDSDIAFMRRALQLALLGPRNLSPNPRVGAVVVSGGAIIGEGFHRGPGTPHAEVDAISTATSPVKGATLYVTLEPCSHFGRTPPCAPFVAEHGIARVVVAGADPNPQVAGRGLEYLRGRGLTVEVGLCGDEAARINEGFLTFHSMKRPFVVSKWAMTLDGRISSDSGHSKWVSNESSRKYVHEIRASVDAVLVGIGTVLVDNPMLNVRLPGFDGRQPRPVIADGSLRIPLRARCLETVSSGKCIIATTQNAPKDRAARLRDAGHEVVVVDGNKGLLDARSLMGALHDLGVQSVLCEGGSSLNASLFQAGVVDKVIAFVAPKIIGGHAAKSPITGWGLDRMDNALDLAETKVRGFGNDVCVEGYLFGLFGRKPVPSEVQQTADRRISTPEG